MALIKCYECGETVSDLAKSCPHCGAPNQTKEQEKSSYVSKLSLLWNKKLIRQIKWENLLWSWFCFLFIWGLILSPFSKVGNYGHLLEEFHNKLDGKAHLYFMTLLSFLSAYIYQIYKIKKNQGTEKKWKGFFRGKRK